MGIPRGTAYLLLTEKRRRDFSGSVLQLGRSSVYLSHRDLIRLAARAGVVLSQIDASGLSHDPRLAEQGCLDDRSFFRLLGFRQVESCDISDWEGADHLFDFNQPAPEHLHRRFDLVPDAGTLIELFHLPNAFANIHALLGPGGRVIHAALPSSNHVDLGFYMICPTLLADYYAANGYTLETIQVARFTSWWLNGRYHHSPWQLYDYRPGCLDHLCQGRLGGRQLALFAVATKTAQATADAVPLLGRAVRSWERFARHPNGIAGDALASHPDSLARAGAILDRLASRHPGLVPVLGQTKRLAEPVRRLLPPSLPRPVGRI